MVRTQGGPTLPLQRAKVVVRAQGVPHTVHKGEPRCQGRRGGQGDRPQGGRACGLAQWARSQAWNPEVGGSNLSVPTITPNTHMTSSRVLLGLLDL